MYEAYLINLKERASHKRDMSETLASHRTLPYFHHYSGSSLLSAAKTF